MPPRAMLRTVAWRVVPGRMADRARTYEQNLREDLGPTDLARQFIAAHGDRVLHGPIAGLRLIADRIDEVDAPTAKLIGCYEAETHAALAAAIASQPSRFIDLGAADGYFAVGVGLAAGIPVDAFDLSPAARDLTRQTAALNGVELTMHAGATTRSVSALPIRHLDRAILLCDIDGPERDLFTPGLVDQVRSSYVIVEMHVKANADVESALIGRFGRTHDVHVVEAVRRDPDAYAELSIFSGDDRDHAINELRYRDDGLRWLIATPG